MSEAKAVRKEDIRISKTPVDFSNLTVFVDGKPATRVQSIQFLPVKADQRLIIAEFSVLGNEEASAGSIFAIPASTLHIFKAFLTSWRNNVLRFVTDPEFPNREAGEVSAPVEAPEAKEEDEADENDPGF